MKPEYIWDYYTQMRSDTYDYRRMRDKYIQAYHGNQWDSGVKDDIESSDQTAVVVNTLRPFIKLRAAMMTAQPVQGTLYGYDKQDMDTATALDDLLNHIQYISNFNKVVHDVCLSQQREGVGYLIVSVDPDADYGRGEIVIKSESYDNVFVDRNTSEWDYSDAAHIIHTKLVDVETFVNMYPDIAKEIEIDKFTVDPDNIVWDGESERDDANEAPNIGPKGTVYKYAFIRLFDVYERIMVDQKVMEYMTGRIELLSDDYELTETDNALIKDGTVSITSYKVPRIRLTQAVANELNYYVVDSTILPIKHYPIIPVINEETGNALHTGEIDYVFGLQELKNKAFSLMLYNAAVSSNFRYLGDKNAVQSAEDMEEIRAKLYTPGGISWLNRSPDGKWPIEELRPEPIANAFYMLVEHLTGDIQMGLGTYSLRAGDPSQVPETATMGLSLAQWSQDILRPSLMHLELAIERAMNVCLELIPSVYSRYKVLSVVGQDGTEKVTGINQPVRDENLDITEVLNDVTKLYVRYRIKVGSTLPTNSIAKLQLFKDLAATNPVFIEYLIDYLPELKDKDKAEIKERISLLPQLQSQLEQSSQAIEQLKKQVTKLTEAEMNLRKSLEVERTKTALAKQLGNKRVEFEKSKNKSQPTSRQPSNK